MTTDLHTRLSRISHILSNGGTVATERVVEALSEAAASLVAKPDSDLARRLLEHAATHDACTSEHSDEQAQWARDLREAAAMLTAPSSPCATAETAAQGGERERERFEAAMVEAGYHKPERSPFGSGDQYKYERDQDRFVGWQLALATPAPASPSASTAAAAVAGEPVAFVHWPLSGPPRLVWYSNKAMNAAILKEGHQPDLLLYAAPQPSPGAQAPAPACGLSEERKPLTEEQIDALANDGCRNAAGGIYATRVYEFARAIERAHGIGLTHPDATKETP